MIPYLQTLSLDCLASELMYMYLGRHALLQLADLHIQRSTNAQKHVRMYHYLDIHSTSYERKY